MKPIIFDGRKFANAKLAKLKSKISLLKVIPGLEIILVGNDPASLLYTNLKKKTGEGIGLKININKFPQTVSQDEIIRILKAFSKDDSVHGIMVQLPLPVKFNTPKILSLISKEKDVDGLNPKSNFTPAAVKAIFDILKVEGTINFSLTIVAVVGSCGFVGKSVITNLKKLKCSKIIAIDQNTTAKLSNLRKADIIISATGKPQVITSDLVKKGTVIIDTGSPQGDINFPEVSKQAKFITPVPGGVGPVTISCLLENLYQAAYNQSS